MVAPYENEKVENPWEYIKVLVYEFLPLEKWGFTESARRGSWPKSGNLWPGVIYDSQWCRILILWDGWDMYAGNTISILYGRLHAPGDKAKMNWNEEECFCWHDFSSTGAILNFLDGLTPQESIEQKGFPKIIEQFRQSELWRESVSKRRQPELVMKMHAIIWEYYGLRLFELFDLHRPDLWEQYQQYLKEIYDMVGRNPDIKPSPDKVC